MIGELSALATAFCWSGSSIAFAEATLRIGSVRVNVTRLILAALLLAGTIVAFEIPFHLSQAQFLNLSISGLLGLVFGDTFLFKSYELNGARISSLVMSTAPAITAIFAFLTIHEVLSAWGIIGMIVTLAGIGLVVFRRQAQSTVSRKITGTGIFYPFLGACGQGGGLITAKIAFNEGEINGITATFIRICASLILLVPVARFTGRYKEPWRFYSLERKALGLTFLGAILGPCLGITFSLISIVHVKVAIAATIMATVPIIMLPLVKLIYKECLTWHAYVGAIIAVAGVAILFLR